MYIYELEIYIRYILNIKRNDTYMTLDVFYVTAVIIIILHRLYSFVEILFLSR